MNNKILVSTSTFAKFDSMPLEKLKEHSFEVQTNPHKRTLTKQELMELLPGVVGLVAGVEPIDAEVLNSSDLKVVSRCGAGMSNVDIEAAKARGIAVCNTPDAPTLAVVELTIAGMLNLMRSMPQMNQELHDGQWNKTMGTQLAGKTVAIIGFGRIGQMVAQLLTGFGVEVIVVDPFITKASYEIVSLDEALYKADIVTFHCSGDECILTAEKFKILKKGAYICNAARGGLVDEAALIEALKKNDVAGCWLDTFHEEPYKGELAQFPQAILTPHVGSYTLECRKKMEMQAVDNLLSVLQAIKEVNR